jgi:ParB family chromosome partitioning protein
MVEKRPALGRGLSALIPDTPAPAPTNDRSLDVDTDLLRPNKFQPRTHMDDDRIEDLARSIRANGIIQPIVVRRVDDRDRSKQGDRAGEFEGRQPLDKEVRYEIIAGERRWRAAQRAGLMKVPVVVREIPEDRLLAVALIENIQRENLNPIEEAVAYRRLSDEFHLTQEQIADAVGKDRSSIANYVRLLRLPQEVRASVSSNALSMGHARALLALTDEAAQLRVARDVLSRGLSVRETEALVKKATAPETPKLEKAVDVHTRAAEEKLRLALGTRVHINRKGKGGRLEIEFVNEDELQRLYERLTGE